MNRKKRKKLLVGWTYKGWEKNVGMLKVFLLGRIGIGEKPYEDLFEDHPFLYRYKRDLANEMKTNDPSLFKKVRITIEEVK